MRTLDLNADVGEGSQEDARLIPLITSASVACGAHAGDAGIMRETVALAVRHGVAVGAHPGYADREHFGRRPMHLAEDQLIDLVLSQVSRLDAIATSEGAVVTNMKPHGALYNQAEADEDIAAALVEAVRTYPRTLRLVGRAGSALERAARRAGVPFVPEAFADRRYRPDGSLAPRSQPGSLLDDPDAVAAQVRRLIEAHEVEADDGSRVPVAFETLCLHGDTPGAARLARRVRQLLTELGVTVAASPPLA